MNSDILRVAVLSIADLIVVSNSEGTVTYATPQAKKILGVEAQELIGKKLWNIQSLRDPGKMEEFFMKLKIGRFSKKAEIAEIWRGNEVAHVQIYATPLSDSSGFVLVFRDVTPIIDAYRKIEELNEVLRLMNKMLRHDVLNKLAIVRGYLEILFESADREKIEKALKTIDSAVEIIERMRELEKTLVGSNMKTLKLREVVESVAESVRKFGVEVEIEGEAPVLADDAIYSVIENVMSNSIKHGEATKIYVKIEKEGNFCRLTIADNGKGLPTQFIDKLFTEGFSHGKSAGTGLGLYIVKKVVERYGGSVRAYNRGGAVFEILLRMPLE